MTAGVFIISTNRRLPGARLALSGNWGGIPFPSVEAAEAEAVRRGAVVAQIKREAWR